MKYSKRQFKYAVRRLKRCQDKIKNERLAETLLKNNGDIFHEIKKIRGKSNNFSNRIDDTVGPTDIANKFASIYGELYNRVNLSEDFQRI